MDNKFPQGISVYPPNENAPKFIKADVVVGRDFVAYFNEHQKMGKLRLQLKESKAGKLYLEVNTYEKPTTVDKVKEEINEILNKTTSQGVDGEIINVDEIPF